MGELEKARKAGEAADHFRTSCPSWGDLIDETERGAESYINNHQEKLRKQNMESKPTRGKKEGPLVPRTRTITGTRIGIGWAIVLFVMLLFGWQEANPKPG